MIKEPLPVVHSALYFPQLDSLRGMSFIAIFLFHTIHLPDGAFFLSGFIRYLYTNLPLGIEVFFVLSSFLLTWLGLNEYKKRGNFSFKNYFTRRVLRIWPLYFFILLLAFLIIPLLAASFHYSMTLPNPWYYVFFIANFYTLDHVFFLRMLWTISVEEQFYIFWGWCLKSFYKKLRVVIFLLIIASISFSVYAIIGHHSSYFNTLTYLFDFACGASSAVFLFTKNKIVNWLKNLPPLVTILFYGYLIFHFILFYFLNNYFKGITNDFIALICRYVFIIYIALFIMEQIVNTHRTTFFEKNRFLIFTGKLSYGLYCYHGLMITFVNLLLLGFNINNWILVIIYFTVNYLVATISYFYLETPFLKLKVKLRRI